MPIRRPIITLLLAALVCTASGTAFATVQWRRVGTVTTLTANQICTTNGTDVVCDSTTPTDLGGLIGIGTTSPSQLLTVGGNIDITGSGFGYLTEIANAGTTGTTANKLAKLTTSGAVIAATSDTDGVVGIVTGGAGTTGNAQIAVDGQGSCVFDGATTAGDFVAISTTTAGDCHDAGATRSSSSETIGRVLTTNGSAGTYTVELGLNASAASSGAPAGSGTTNYVARWTPNGSTLGIGTLYDNGTQVGIGTASPAAKLDVYTSTGVGQIDLGGVNGLSYPSSDTTAGGSIAIGSGALGSQPASAAYGSTAVGYQSLSGALTTAATKNTAVGYQAGIVTTSGSSDTFFGYGASLRSGFGTVSNTTVIGASATGGSAGNATAVGASASAGFNGGGSNSTALGYSASANGASSTAVGASATVGNSNGIAIGASATANGHSVVVGYGAGQGSSDHSIIIGENAGISATTSVGAQLVLMGETAGEYISTGTATTGVGFDALLGVTGVRTTGTGNSAFGASAGLKIQGVAAGNSIFGANVASTTLATGLNNIMIGTDASTDATSSSAANTLNIGNTIYGTNMYNNTNSSGVGLIGIGTNAPQSPLSVSGGVAIGSTYAGTNAAPTNGAIIQGAVAVGTTTVPTGVTEAINGLMKVAGTGSESCGAAQVGSIRYNSTGNYFELCSYP